MGRYKMIPVQSETQRKLELLKLANNAKSYDRVIANLIAKSKSKNKKIFEILGL